MYICIELWWIACKQLYSFLRYITSNVYNWKFINSYNCVWKLGFLKSSCYWELDALLDFYYMNATNRKQTLFGISTIPLQLKICKCYTLANSLNDASIIMLFLTDFADYCCVDLLLKLLFPQGHKNKEIFMKHYEVSLCILYLRLSFKCNLLL